MPRLFLVVGVVVFLFLLHRFGVVERVKMVMRASRTAIAVMRADDMPDDQKERAIQKAAGRMTLAFFDIVLRSATAAALPFACVYAGMVAGLFTPDEAMRAAWSPYFLLALVLISLVGWRFVR